MGYSIKLAKISIKEYEEIKKWKFKELVEHYSEDNDEDYLYIGDIVDRFYELGDFNTDMVKNETSQFFLNKQTHNKMFDYSVGILSKKGLEIIIDYYSNLVASFYKEEYESLHNVLIKNKEDSNVFKLLRSLESKKEIWKDDIKPYNLKDQDTLTDSWKYEYAIFQLVYIHKTFNFKKNLLIIYGS